MKDNYRNGTIDIYKFLIMVFCIMGGHFCMAYPIEGVYPFYSNGIFVELYLIITGFYTYHHFNGHQNEGILQYTLKKFLRFFPYLVIANLILYLGSKDLSFSNIWNMFVEDVLLTSVFLENGFRNGPLWMLSAMWVIFPAFCLICLIKNKRIVEILSITIPLCYYSDINMAITAQYPYQLIRVLSGMLIGIFIYELNEQQILKLPNNKSKYIIGILICFLLLFISGLGFSNRRVILVLEFFSLLFLLDINGLASRKSNKVTTYLGDISMVIYIIHAPVAVCVYYVAQKYNSIFMSLLMYYIGTFFLSMLLFHIINRLNKHKNL